MILELRKKLLAVAFVVPLNSNNHWINLPYKGIEPNKVTFADSGLTLAINNSASPLVYPLPAPKLIAGFKIKLKITGQISQKDSLEDSFLRVGFVVPGTRRLNAIQRMMAAPWVKELFKLAPKDSGIDKIYFFGLTELAPSIGSSRAHPKSDLIHETWVALAKPDGQEYEVVYQLKEPKKVAALWLAADGDDTHSKFTIQISHLELVE